MTCCKRNALSLLIALVAGAAVAQEGPPSQYEHVKGLEPFIGFWQGDFQPPGGPEGTVTGFCRWTSNRSYAQFQWSFQPEGGERMHVGTVLIGWDGGVKGLKSWTFFPEGQSQGEASLEDGVLTVMGRGTTADGQATSAKATYKVSEDELTLTVSDAKVGDEEMPGYSFTVQKRERPGRGG